MKNITATVYLQVQPTFSRYASLDGVASVTGLSVVSHTTKRPRQPRGGAVVVKLTLEFPESAFQPLQPEATIVIPDSMIEAHPVQVEAESPTDE